MQRYHGGCDRPGREGRPLRVALVADSYNFIADGVALTLNRLVGYLEGHGVEVLVFAPTADAPALAHQGTAVSVPSIAPARPARIPAGAGHARGVKRQLLDFEPDLIHIAVPDLLGQPRWRWRSATAFRRWRAITPATRPI